MGPDEAHVRLLEAAPELGPAFGMDAVLLGLAHWAWERRADEDLVRRYLAYVDWLVEHGPPEVAELALAHTDDFPFGTLGLGA